MGTRVGTGDANSEVYEETTGMDTGPLSRTLAFRAAWRQDCKALWERDRETEEPLTFGHSSEGKIQCT